jgi:hypothetical protein
MPLRFADPAEETYRFPLTIGRLLDSALITVLDLAAGGSERQPPLPLTGPCARTFSRSAS